MQLYNKKNKYLILLSCGLVIWGISISSKNIGLIKQLEEKTSVISNLKERVAIHSDYSGYYKFDLSTELYDLKNKKLFFKDIVSKTTLVLSINNYSCNTCIKKEIGALQEKTANLKNQVPVIILASGYSLRGLNLLCLKEGIKVPIYSVKRNIPFFNKMNGAKVPFLFLLSPELEVSNVFFPSQVYRKESNDRYFNNAFKTIYGQQPPSGGNGPVITVLNPTIDLGAINIREKHTVEFEVRNDGKKPCIINEIKTSCGCMLLKTGYSPINPGDVRKIKVEVLLKNKGYFSKPVSLHTNSKLTPIVDLWVQGSVM